MTVITNVKDIIRELNSIVEPQEYEVHKLFTLGNRKFDKVILIKKFFKELKKQGGNRVGIDCSSKYSTRVIFNNNGSSITFNNIYEG